MLCQVALLLLLSSLQPGSLHEIDIELILNNVATRISGLVVALDSKVDLLRQKVESDFQSLRKTLDTLNHSMSNLSVGLQEHKEQTKAELARLQTSLNSTQSSLDNQTGQLNKLDGLSTELCSKMDTLNSTQSSDAMQLNNKLDTLNSTRSYNAMQLNNKLDGLSTELCSKLDTLNSTQSSNVMQLNNKLDDMSSKTNAHHSIITEHQQQTTAELAHLQTSLNSTNSKLDSLTATAAQLSSDHQKIQTNISDVQCMDTQPSLQLHQNLHNNFTHQLKKIQDDVTFIREQHWCGGTGGWRRVVYLNMAHPHTTCPSGWNMTGYSKRTCGRNSTGHNTCSTATFPVSGGEYDSVCGRIKAYQRGGAVAFSNYHYERVTTIDGVYASGVSVTRGTPRNHIWTFVTGLSEGDPTWTTICPCDATSTIRIPPFVGNDYFCESGVNENWYSSSNKIILHSNDTLWDGEDCLPSSTCCSLHNPPYFTKQLPTPTTDDIEARICVHYPLGYENLAVELVELYVQ